MAANAAMMAAIAAATKGTGSDGKKRKAADAGLDAGASDLIPEGTEVEYWSDSKKRWVDAIVMGTRDKDGAKVYELDVKGTAPLDKVRRRAAGGFQSFVRFDDKQTKLEVERAKLAKAKAQEEAAAKQSNAKPEPVRIDFKDPPTELLPPEKFADGQDQAGFVEHFARYFLGVWKCEQEAGFEGYKDMARKLFQGHLSQTEEEITPLLVRLRSGEALERGESQEDRKMRRCARGAQDGFSVAEHSVLGQLAQMATSASQRNYSEANEAYMKLTLGSKTWHNTCVVHVSANTMQGAREYRRNRDDLNTYDVDPVARKYMHAMRRIMQFAQCVRPNEDVSKHVPL